MSDGFDIDEREAEAFIWADDDYDVGDYMLAMEQKVYDYAMTIEAMRRADEDRRSMAVAAHAFVAFVSALLGAGIVWLVGG